MSITEEQTIWFPGVYDGREGDYAKKVVDVSLLELTNLVKKRAEEDGEWTIANGHVGDNEAKMRKMMEWVSRDINIQQCVAHILKNGEEYDRTVDWVCRDLANASKRLGGARG
jgi:hypothetical protein